MPTAIISGAQEVTIAGQSVLLLPQKAMFIANQSKNGGTLLLADVHIGKASAFRSRNFYAPDGISNFDLLRLSELVEKLSVTRVVILGDLVHSQDGMSPVEVESFEHFQGRHKNLEVILVLGNHDRKVKLPASWRLDLVDVHMVDGPFVYSHELIKSKGKYVLCGHVHPSVVLSGPAHQRERLPCFWLRTSYAILPAYGVFTGSYTIKPSRADKVFVVAHDTVVRMA